MACKSKVMISDDKQFSVAQWRWNNHVPLFEELSNQSVGWSKSLPHPPRAYTTLRLMIQSLNERIRRMSTTQQQHIFNWNTHIPVRMFFVLSFRATYPPSSFRWWHGSTQRRSQVCFWDLGWELWQQTHFNKYQRHRRMIIANKHGPSSQPRMTSSTAKTSWSIPRCPETLFIPCT